MATDPVTAIQEREHERPVSHDLFTLVRQLAELPPSPDAPWLTLNLDWRPDGSRPDLRPARLFFRQQADELRSRLHPHTPLEESIAGDLDRIADFLDREAEPVTKGIVIFACAARDVFVAVPLGEPVPNRLTTGPTPALRVLAGYLDDRPPFGILVADQKHAQLWLIDQTRPVHSLDIEATGDPRKQAQGGWSERRYQARADERVEAFVAVVASEVRRVVEESGIGELVIGGERQITAALVDALPVATRDIVVGTFRPNLDRQSWDRDVQVKQFVDAALPLVDAAEWRREQRAVRAVLDGAGPGGRAVAGVVETLSALQTAQVMTLVMSEEFQARGWADYTLPLFGAGPVPKQHPSGGSVNAIRSIALEEELVRLAILNRASIRLVTTVIPPSPDESALPARGDRPRTQAAQELDRIGGVGALLRFTLSPVASTIES